MNTSPIQRILVPTDLSDFSDLAMQYAQLFQRRLGSQITVVYAEEFTFVFTGEYPIGYYFEDVTEVKKHASKLLHNWVKTHVASTCPVATMLIDDIPGRAIVRTAEDVNADLIIMGTHGRHGVRRAILGSVTERVLRDSDRPVMTVLPKAAPTDADVNIRTILCPVNFSDVAREALENACALAGAFGAQLIVANVIERGESVPAGIDERFRAWVDPLVRGNTSYEAVVVSGDPATRMLEIADQTRSDLIVLGAQHKLFSDSTVIGTTTERITRFARQPVLTIVRRPVAREVRREELVTVP